VEKIASMKEINIQGMFNALFFTVREIHVTKILACARNY